MQLAFVLCTCYPVRTAFGCTVIRERTSSLVYLQSNSSLIVVIGSKADTQRSKFNSITAQKFCFEASRIVAMIVRTQLRRRA